MKWNCRFMFIQRSNWNASNVIGFAYFYIDVWYVCLWTSIWTPNLVRIQFLVCFWIAWFWWKDFQFTLPNRTICRWADFILFLFFFNWSYRVSDIFVVIQYNKLRCKWQISLALFSATVIAYVHWAIQMQPSKLISISDFTNASKQQSFLFYIFSFSWQQFWLYQH